MSVRSKVLEAALDLAVARGWAKVTMAELAAAAGVSRQSIYNEFGSREGVALALIGAEVDGFLGVVATELAWAAEPVDAVGRAAASVFDLAAENPLLRSVLAGDDPSLVPLLSSEAVLSAARDRVRVGLTAADEVAVDAIVRLVVSHILSPGQHPPDMREVARRLLGAAR